MERITCLFALTLFAGDGGNRAGALARASVGVWRRGYAAFFFGDLGRFRS